MKKYIFVLSILFTFKNSIAAEKHDHREHGAHVHGSAELSLGFDGSQGKIEFKSPSESLFGFEHGANSAADKKAVETAFKKFETNIGEMIQFEKNLQCRLTKEKIEVVAEGGNHSDTTAAFAVKCDKSPLGSKVIFNFQKFFPGLKDIDAQIIVDALQKSAEIKASGYSLELK